jgi:23S rRNA (cytosine1962-C5)-methyltransferase
VDVQQQQLANRIARVYKHRRKWAKRSDISCYRLYEKDIADQPLIVDWYDGDAIIWAFHRTRNEDAQQERFWLDGVLEAVGSALQLPSEHLFLKQRRPQRDRQGAGAEPGGGEAGGEGGEGKGKSEATGQYQRVDQRHVVKVVREQGLLFEVNLSDFLDTGLFLDHRVTRLRVRQEAAGKRVLNLFAYTGAFTCYACAGGASATTTVDLSNTYLEWARRNLALNGVAEGPHHQVVRADCLAWLSQAARQGERYDLIICDPPTFSNSTSMDHDFSVGRDYPQLLQACRALLAEGGDVYFSTNFRGFELRDPLAGWFYEELSATSVPEDFRDRKIHRSWRMRATPRT